MSSHGSVNSLPRSKTGASKSQIRLSQSIPSSALSTSHLSELSLSLLENETLELLAELDPSFQVPSNQKLVGHTLHLTR